MTDKNTCDLTVWVSPELRFALQTLADEDERAMSAYLRVLLRDHVDTMTKQRAREQEKPSGRIGASATVPFSDAERMA